MDAKVSLQMSVANFTRLKTALKSFYGYKATVQDSETGEAINNPETDVEFLKRIKAQEHRNQIKAYEIPRVAFDDRAALELEIDGIPITITVEIIP